VPRDPEVRITDAVAETMLWLAFIESEPPESEARSSLITIFCERLLPVTIVTSEPVSAVVMSEGISTALLPVLTKFGPAGHILIAAGLNQQLAVGMRFPNPVMNMLP